MRVHHQPAYILLNRPYSETSWIVEIFSRDYGRLSLMAKGARRLKSKLKGSLLPFQPVLLSWVGKGEMPTLTSAEVDQSEFDFFVHELTGDALVCGFYCNELVVNLLHRHDPHPSLFDHYHRCIMTMNASTESIVLSNALREFEQVVMRETGYEVSFDYEADGRTAIESGGFYYFQSNKGFIRMANDRHSRAISGRIILTLKQNVAHIKPQDLSQSKLLMRDILAQILGSKKIVSRELFLPKLRN